MREGWKEVAIGDLGQVITGNTPPRKQPDLYGEHTIFVKPTDMEVDRKYCYNPEEYYSEKGFLKYKKSLIPKGSTCVVTIGSIGQKMIKAHTELFINQAVNAIVPNNHYDEDFVYYLIKINLFQLKTFDSGTASGRENVSKSSFSNIKVIVPQSKKTQSKIASILSAYDDLIENNLKRIKLLEEKAQRTYEEWFVKMRFPGYENAKFDEVTKLPEGWENMKVNFLLEKVKSVTKIKTSDILERGKIPVIDQSRNFIAGYTNDKTSIIEIFKPLIVFGDHTRCLKFVNFSFARGADGTQLVLSNNKRMPQHLFYHVLMNIDLSNYHYARHFKFLKECEIILPDFNTSNKYEIVVKPIFDLIDKFRKQNHLLKEVRDILLPRLMNGIIDVEQLKTETVKV